MVQGHTTWNRVFEDAKGFWPIHLHTVCLWIPRKFASDNRSGCFWCQLAKSIVRLAYNVSGNTVDVCASHFKCITFQVFCENLTSLINRLVSYNCQYIIRLVFEFARVVTCVAPIAVGSFPANPQCVISSSTHTTTSLSSHRKVWGNTVISTGFFCLTSPFHVRSLARSYSYYVLFFSSCLWRLSLSAQEWTNRTPISHKPLICSKMCFTKTELVQQ